MAQLFPKSANYLAPASIAALVLVAGGAVAFLTSVSCGHAAMQQRALLATLWLPAVCWVGAMLTVIEQHGGVRYWEVGVKDGVWDPTTLGLLGTLVALYFAFLAGQGRYHHAVWAAGATDTPTTVTQHQRGAALRLTRRGGLAIILLALLVTAATASLAPYLWRTAPREGQRPGDGASDPRGRERRPPPGERDPRGRRAPHPDAQALREAVSRAARKAREQAEDVLPFVPLFFLNRPVRRWWRLRRLRRGGRADEPTKRALRRWEYVTVALGDVGIRVLPGDTVDELVARLLGARGVFLRGDDGCEEWAVSRGDDGLTLRRQWIEPGWPRSDRDARLTVTRTIHVQAGGLALSPSWTREREQRRGPDGGWRPDGGLVGSTLCVADPALRRTDDGAGYVIGGAVLHLSRAACERPLAQPVAGCT